MTKKSKNSRKRENGDGTLWQRPSGTWVATVTVPHSGGKRLSASAKSRDQARVELGNLLERAKKLAPVQGKGAGRTVSELANLWLDSKSVDEASRASLVYALAHIDWIGQVVIQKVTAVMLTEWMSETRKRMVAGWTDENGRRRGGARQFELVAGIVRSVCEYAVNLGLIRSTPFVMKIPRTKPKDVVPFTPEETLKIFAEALGDRVGAAIVITFGGAFRGGEVFGMHWGDIDWERSEVAVSRQVVQRKGGLQSKAPKTRTGTRRIALPPFAMAALRERQKLAVKEGRAGLEWWVFPSRNGKPMSRSNYGKRHWAPILEKLGLPHRGMHHARHTSLSIMLSQKVSVQEVANVAGHATPTILLDTYAHMLPGTGRAAADAIQTVLGCNAVAAPSTPTEKAAS